MILTYLSSYKLFLSPIYVTPKPTATSLAQLYGQNLSSQIFIESSVNIEPSLPFLEDTNSTLYLRVQQFQFTINQPKLCDGIYGNQEKAIVVVCSAISNFLLRQAVRTTWSSEATTHGNFSSVRVVFLLGMSTDNKTEQLVHSESVKYSDVIQANFIDSYKNLTLKSALMLRWVTEFCNSVNILVKIDDDTYLNLEKLMKKIRSSHPSNSLKIHGLTFGRSRPVRKQNHKWFVSVKEFPYRHYPEYASGPMYFMPVEAARRLYGVVETTRYISMEDVFVTGLCAEKAGIKRAKVAGIKTLGSGSFRLHACAFSRELAIHHITYRMLITRWKYFQLVKSKCKSY
ncbi:beta-1,3-galactosyltransferase 5-like [Limulus polyphemus]|uniref:Hexosyltransferase n=1 Tax=Limulus polyphemus TaxID=6850 RepID=A0ABM1B3C9_LIMPO|nr:beta-1,3-galactosyltransferase 5-like [Limulus polyphemus]